MHRIALLLSSLCLIALPGVTNAIAASSATSASTPAIRVYGSNAPAGTAFAVTVSATDGSQAQAVPVELLRQSNTTLHYARLAFQGTIQVAVRVPNATDYSVSPRRYGLAITRDTGAQTLTFTISNDVASPYFRPNDGVIRLVVHDHYGTGAKLFLFADWLQPVPERDGVTVFDAAQDFGIVPDAADNTAAINAAIQSLSAMHVAGSAMLLFPDGVYQTGTVTMQDDVTLYLTGKATLMRPSSATLSGAFITFNGVRNAHVRGPGVVNANLWHATSDKIVLMSGASYCSLEDVTMTGTGNWTVHILDSSDVVGKNYKIINEITANSDGTDPDRSKRVTLAGIFEFTGDDGFAVKTSPGGSGATDSVTILNAVIWTEKSALKVGSEVTRAINHVAFTDNQVISADRGLALYGNGSGVSGGSVDGVTFTNNTIEKIQNLTFGRNVDFMVQYFSDPAPYAPIRNVLVTDTFCYSNSPNQSNIAGAGGTTISNVTFERFWVDDAHTMVATSMNNVGTYVTVGSGTSNITFVNDEPPLSVDAPAASALTLAPIAPNPARGAASIVFTLARPSAVVLSVMDVTGREVARLADGPFAAGTHRVAWPPALAMPGTYYVRLGDGHGAIVRSLTLLR